MKMKKNTALKIFLFVLSVTTVLSMLPQQADARRGHANVNHNRNVNKNVNVNRNSNRNTNVNVNKRTNVNVNVDHRRGRNYHPVATGVAIGATAAVTAAVVGSMVNTLPPSGCTIVIRNGISYSQCGSVWYEPRYSGNSVTYIVVNPM